MIFYLRVFTSYNEKGIHVWHPESAEKLFQVNFDIGAATQAISENVDDATEIIQDKKSKKGKGK